MLSRIKYLKLYNSKIDKKPRFIEKIINSDLSPVDSEGNKSPVNLKARYGILEGVASTTFYQSGQKVKVEPYAFADSLKTKDLNSLTGIRFKFDHKYETVYDASGIIKKLEYSDDGSTLFIEVWIRVGLSSVNSDEIKDDPKNMKVYLDSILGTAGFSVGFRAIEQDATSLGNVIYKADLEEVSLTKYPSDVYAYACSDTDSSSDCETCKNKGNLAMSEANTAEVPTTTTTDLDSISTKLTDLTKTVESLVTTLPNTILKTISGSSSDTSKVEDKKAALPVEPPTTSQYIDLSDSSMQVLTSHITNAIKDVMGASNPISDKTTPVASGVEGATVKKVANLNNTIDGVTTEALIQNLSEKYANYVKGTK